MSYVQVCLAFLASEAESMPCGIPALCWESGNFDACFSLGVRCEMYEL